MSSQPNSPFPRDHRPEAPAGERLRPRAGLPRANVRGLRSTARKFLLGGGNRTKQAKLEARAERREGRSSATAFVERFAFMPWDCLFLLVAILENSMLHENGLAQIAHLFGRQDDGAGGERFCEFLFRHVADLPGWGENAGLFNGGGHFLDFAALPPNWLNQFSPGFAGWIRAANCCRTAWICSSSLTVSGLTVEPIIHCKPMPAESTGSSPTLASFQSTLSISSGLVSSLIIAGIASTSFGQASEISQVPA